MKRVYSTIFICALILVTLSGCSNNLQKSEEVIKKDINITTNKSSVLYTNAQYGFSFSLPESWKGYSIVKDKWEGLAIGSKKGETVVETGQLISIRHPKWTSQNPRQDIPILIFTLNQWNSLQQGKFHIGAAPIGPIELGRNSSYVFALPARYNFAFLQGYVEVEDIIKSNPLQANLNN